ncbi:hypothetical protein [Roseateles amylovorans]|uniref:Uncharacterized protein n=1 Tax=Roseateles amylovorans TaxID=2978473 RepID=A0ABY6AXQ0_9BURK|nr:hypothetical protein [Roseateles amylovorans]UXH77575.1 hypothetical protein N4261_21690 [Roseateles amylovorans]
MKDSDRALVARSSNFTIRLLTSEAKWEGGLDATHAVHRTVLRPLLAMADGCWAYGIDKDGPLWKRSADILQPDRGKFRIDLSCDPVSGRESLWNASGGKRGTIVITVPVERFDGAALFPHCLEAWVFDNPRAGHTPGALSFTSKRLAEGRHVIVCLPRNNGIEWAEVFAPQPLVFDLYAEALAATASAARGLAGSVAG